MPMKLSTTMKKIVSTSEHNRAHLNEFIEYMRSRGSTSECNIVNVLNLMISFDRYFDGLPFTSINEREQVLRFLDHQFIKKIGKWVKREHDVEGKWIATRNQNLTWIRLFFRWLVNMNKDENDWETPQSVRIKHKKPLRDSPYKPTDLDS